ncbi:MAG: FHA domain-containing protein, partial [Deltaproteobacteria bacterium]|nr:FHA domain-containing protein [Deltaproteobacteria bacterium]
MEKLALRFISGKYKGGEFVLSEGKQIIIGRSSDAEVVLMEDMVSRRHAHLVVKGEKIYLEDRGSTNGTFVNGEKISKAVASKGDRVLIGTSIM